MKDENFFHTNMNDCGIWIFSELLWSWKTFYLGSENVASNLSVQYLMLHWLFSQRDGDHTSVLINQCLRLWATLPRLRGCPQPDHAFISGMFTCQRYVQIKDVFTPAICWQSAIYSYMCRYYRYVQMLKTAIRSLLWYVHISDMFESAICSDQQYWRYNKTKKLSVYQNEKMRKNTEFKKIVISHFV